MKRSSPELLQGTLDMLILQALLAGPMHGYAIVRKLQEVSKDVLRVEEGSLYPALHRMEQRSWISSEWGTSENNRQARFYKLTRSGRRQLEAEAINWERLSKAIAQVMRTA
jgi:PadR family transcriptional regulator PadR